VVSGRHLILDALVGAAATLVPASTAGATSTKSQEDISGHVFTCPSVSMTAVPGSIIYITEHHGTSGNGNANDTLTATARHNELIGSDGNTYYEIGALWAGDTIHANTGGGQTTFTSKVQFVTRGGGIVGSTNATIHTSPNGNVVDMEFGQCTL
jgi:hypothetical protein